MILSRCEDCNHRNICKHSDEYIKLLSEINVKVPEPFTLSLNCKHYYSTTAYLDSQYWATSDCTNSIAQCSRTAL